MNDFYPYFGRQRIARRDVLRLGGAALTLAGSAWLTGCRSDSRSAAPPANAAPPDVEIALRAAAAEATIFDGPATRVQTFQGELLSGPTGSLQTLPDSYLGPILRLQKGQRLRVQFHNNLDEETIVHWHGLHVPAAMDGHPRLAIGPGERYTYEFTVQNRAGTYWFHPHPHGRTGPQVYAGMAGLFLIADDEEAALNLPSGDADIPLVIQDRAFDSENQLVYLPNGMMDRMMGMRGDRILVNGRPDYVLPVATRAYRLRLLNGSNSRVYRLAWSDGSPLTVIAGDGGLLERPLQREFMLLAPGERIELWTDFRGRVVGDELQLRSLPIAGIELDGGMMGGRGGMMGDGRQSVPFLSHESEFPICTVRVETEAQDDRLLPERLSAPGFLAASNAVNQNNPRTFTASMNHMDWLLNGRSFEMEAVADNEIVQLGNTEVWEFVNQTSSRGMMGGMAMAHPIHVHGLQFQIVERQAPGDADLKANWEAVQPGMLDNGWKDTFLLMPGERVKILLRFADYDGLYLYHCHNLEHEDGGMMRNYLVEA